MWLPLRRLFSTKIYRKTKDFRLNVPWFASKTRLLSVPSVKSEMQSHWKSLFSSIVTGRLLVNRDTLIHQAEFLLYQGNESVDNISFLILILWRLDSLSIKNVMSLLFQKSALPDLNSYQISSVSTEAVLIFAKQLILDQMQTKKMPNVQLNKQLVLQERCERWCAVDACLSYCQEKSEDVTLPIWWTFVPWLTEQWTILSLSHQQAIIYENRRISDSIEEMLKTLEKSKSISSSDILLTGNVLIQVATLLAKFKFMTNKDFHSGQSAIQALLEAQESLFHSLKVKYAQFCPRTCLTFQSMRYLVSFCAKIGYNDASRVLLNSLAKHVSDSGDVEMLSRVLLAYHLKNDAILDWIKQTLTDQNLTDLSLSLTLIRQALYQLFLVRDERTSNGWEILEDTLKSLDLTKTSVMASLIEAWLECLARSKEAATSEKLNETLQKYSNHVAHSDSFPLKYFHELKLSKESVFCIELAFHPSLKEFQSKFMKWILFLVMKHVQSEQGDLSTRALQELIEFCLSMNKNVLQSAELLLHWMISKQPNITALIHLQQEVAMAKKRAISTSLRPKMPPLFHTPLSPHPHSLLTSQESVIFLTALKEMYSFIKV